MGEAEAEAEISEMTLMLSDPVVWVFSLGVLVFLATLSLGIWSDIRERKRIIKETDAILQQLPYEGFSESDVEAVGNFVRRCPRIGPLVLRDRAQIGKDLFLALTQNSDSEFPAETWQEKVKVIGLFLAGLIVVPSLVIGMIFLLGASSQLVFISVVVALVIYGARQGTWETDQKRIVEQLHERFNSLELVGKSRDEVIAEFGKPLLATDSPFVPTPDGWTVFGVNCRTFGCQVNVRFNEENKVIEMERHWLH
jgi:hypothetical protein